MNNNNAFTLMELVVAMIIVTVMTAGGLYIYSGIIASSSATAVAKSITQLEKAVDSYAQMNGGSYTNISPSMMQANELLPASWTIKGNWGYPKNADGPVSGYYIGQNMWGVTGSYIIGLNAPTMTNAQALNICNTLENSIDAFGFNGTNYNLPQYNCPGVIPDNKNAIGYSEIFFGFE